MVQFIQVKLWHKPILSECQDQACVVSLSTQYVIERQRDTETM